MIVRAGEAVPLNGMRSVDAAKLYALLSSFQGGDQYPRVPRGSGATPASAHAATTSGTANRYVRANCDLAQAGAAAINSSTVPNAGAPQPERRSRRDGRQRRHSQAHHGRREVAKREKAADLLGACDCDHTTSNPGVARRLGTEGT